MKVFWIRFADAPSYSPMQRGMGVTAYNENDAAALIHAAVGAVTVAQITEVKSIDELEQNHVVPNMGNFFRRGIWFPLGYEQAGS
jgi:hypothetical protein